jgi:nicotinamide-nucleotide amidase
MRVFRADRWSDRYRMPAAEIIAVGSELLAADKIDTNSLFLAGELNGIGIEVVRKTVVGDDRARLADSVRSAVGRSAILILTGGLGPTEDDVTRDAVAAALGRELVFSEEVCDAIRARFRSFGRRMAEVNKRQALVIAGAEVLANPRGTAPGLWVDTGTTVVALLPGPPREMMPLFTAECIPRLRAKFPSRAIRTRFFRASGIGEGDLDQTIAPVYTRYRNPVTTILASSGDIQIHLRAQADTAAEAERLLDEVAGQILPLLGDKVYSRNGDPLEVVIGNALRERGRTLGVAESCTGGLLGGRVTAVPGSSDYFGGGFVTYTNEMKTALLGVPAELIAAHTAVSEPVARAMAEGARQRTGADYALSVTGYAGPDGGTPENPVGTVFVGLATPDGVEARRLRLPGDRERIRGFAVQNALDMLRRALGL